MSSSRAGSRGICPGTWEGRPEEAAPKSSPPQGAARRACPQRTSRGRRGDARGRQALPPPGDAPTPQSTAPQRGTVPGAPPTSLLTPPPRSSLQGADPCSRVTEWKLEPREGSTQPGLRPQSQTQSTQHHGSFWGSETSCGSPSSPRTQEGSHPEKGTKTENRFIHITSSRPPLWSSKSPH